GLGDRWWVALAGAGPRRACLPAAAAVAAIRHSIPACAALCERCAGRDRRVDGTKCCSSRPYGRALSSAGERCLHTAEVTGSKPVAPTGFDHNQRGGGPEAAATAPLEATRRARRRKRPESAARWDGGCPEGRSRDLAFVMRCT